MDNIFLMIPLSLLWLEWFEYYSLWKSSIFSKCSEMLEIDHFYSAVNLNFLVSFFQKALIWRLFRIWTKLIDIFSQSNLKFENWTSVIIEILSFLGHRCPGMNKVVFDTICVSLYHWMSHAWISGIQTEGL